MLKVPRAGIEARFRLILALQVLCRERDSNPHNHYWSRDFKSLVSTNSTIAAGQLLCISSCKGNVYLLNCQNFYTI